MTHVSLKNIIFTMLFTATMLMSCLALWSGPAGDSVYRFPLRLLFGRNTAVIEPASHEQPFSIGNLSKSIHAQETPVEAWRVKSSPEKTVVVRE